MSNTKDNNLSIFGAIEERRSIKRYDAEHKMSVEELDSLVRYASLAPTAYNIQPNRYVVVTDEAIKSELGKAAHNQPQVTESSAVIIITGKLDAYKDAARYWPDAKGDALKYIVNAITESYQGNEDAQKREAVLSAGFTAQNLMLAARGMGYDTCPMEGFDYEKVGKIINLPENQIVVLMIAVGKKAAEPHPKSGLLPLDELIIREHF